MNKRTAQQTKREALLAHQRMMQTLADKIAIEDKIASLRSAVAAQRDSCHLQLAMELLSLRAQTGATWFDLAEALGQACDYTTLFKLAKRQTYVTRPRFIALGEAINAYRATLGMTAVQWETWASWEAL